MISYARQKSTNENTQNDSRIIGVLGLNYFPLNRKGFPFELRYIGLGAPNSRDSLLKSSLCTVVPIPRLGGNNSLAHPWKFYF